MLSKISITDFGRIDHLEISCKGKNVFIVGENGQGKSTILEAISLALCGKVAKNKTIDSWIRRGSGKKNFEIRLTFDNGFVIERKMAGSKLYMDGTNVLSKVNEIYNTLSFDPELFYNLSYVKQGQIAEFFEGNKGIVDKLTSLVVNTKKIESGYTMLTKANTSLNKEISDLQLLLQTPFEEVDVDVLQNEIEELRRSIVELPDEALLKQHQAYHNTLSALRIQLQSKEAEYVEFKKHTVPMPAIAAKDAAQYKRNYNALLPLTEQVQNLQQVVDNWCNIQANQEVMTALVDFFGINTKLVKETYEPELLQAITNAKVKTQKLLTTPEYTTLDEAKVLMDTLIKHGTISSEEIMEAKETYNTVLPILQPIAWAVKELKAKDATPETVPDLVQDMIDAAVTKLDAAKEQLEQVKQLPTMTDEEYSALLVEWERYTSFQKRSVEIEEAIRTLKNQIEGIEKLDLIPLDEITSSLELIARQGMIKNAIQDKERLLASYLTMKKERDQRQKVLDQKLRVLERLKPIKEALRILAPSIRESLFAPISDIINLDFKELFYFEGLGEISIDWQKVEMKIGDETFSGLSGAQQCTLALITRLALLKRLGQFVPIMLIDEPTIHLDEVRRGNLREYLQLLGRQVQLFVCTHDVNIIDPVSSIVYEV